MEDTASAIPISPPGYSAAGAPVSASYPSHSRHPFPIFRGGDHGRDLRSDRGESHYSSPPSQQQRARSRSPPPPPSQRFKYSPPPPSQSRNQATPTSSDIYDQHPVHLIRSSSRHSDVHQPESGSRPPSNKTVDSSSGGHERSRSSEQQQPREQPRRSESASSHPPNEYGVRTTPPASEHHQVKDYETGYRIV